MPRLTERVRSIVRSAGWDVVRFRGDLARHQLHLLQTRQVTVIADVGANEGQYASRMRLLGYAGSIVSFEPYPAAARQLRVKADRDGRWLVHEVALDSSAGHRVLNVSGNSVSSSLLEMTDRHVAAAPQSGYVEQLEVQAKTLDAFVDDLTGRVWMKIDVQGGELRVLEGAVETLKRTEIIQAELSLVELYRNSTTALDLIQELSDLGFDLVNLEPGFTDGRTGALLQADGLFLARRSRS